MTARLVQRGSRARGRRIIRRAPRPRNARSELHLRRRLRAFVGGEFRHRLVAAEDGLRPEHGREGAQRRVIGPHRLDIVAPRDRDAVLGAFELRLQRQEVLRWISGPDSFR